MANSLISPAGDELELLREQYDRLCDLMTRTAESDPAAAERVLIELQSLSERILLLQTARAGIPEIPAAPLPEPPDVPTDAAPAAAESTPAFPPAPEEPVVAGPPPSEALAAEPDPAPARIVAFRVTPSVGPRVSGESASPPVSWRLDAPAADLGPPAAAAPGGARLDPPAPRPLPAAAPLAAEAVTARPAEPEEAELDDVVVPEAVREEAEPEEFEPQEVEPEEAEAEEFEPEVAEPQEAAPVAPASPILLRPQPAPSTPEPGAPDPTQFTSAIRQWLERRRGGADGSVVAPAPAARVEPRRGTTPYRAAPLAAEAAPSLESSPAFSRMVAAVEQQAAQIERIIELCEAHQQVLERLEARIEARTDAPRPAEPDPEIPELRAAVEEQRQRITALAKTIHNLAQWLATQRPQPGR